MLLIDELLFVQIVVFKLIKDDVMEGLGCGYDVIGVLNIGKNEVIGVEVVVNGQVIENLSIQINGVVMDFEILEFVFSLDSVGLLLVLFVNKSFYVQVCYQLMEDFVFGGDFIYKDKMIGGQFDIGLNGLEVLFYSLVNLFVLYNMIEDLMVCVNFGNVFDKEYYIFIY